MHRVELVRGEDQVQQPCRGASQAIEEVLGAALHMKFLALLCPETVSAPKSLIKTSLFIPPFGGTQKRAVFSFFFFFFFFLGLSSYIVYVTGISTCRNLRVVSSQTLGCYRTCELPPVSGKFCMIDGGVGLSGLGAAVPCIYETRDDELPGSAPVGSSSHLFSHLIGACNNIAQTL